MDAVFAVTFGMLVVGGLLTLVRLLRGPTVLDRIVALDMLGILLAAGIAVDAARTGSTVNVALMVVIVLLSFVASVTAARLVEEQG